MHRLGKATFGKQHGRPVSRVGNSIPPMLCALGILSGCRSEPEPEDWRTPVAAAPSGAPAPRAPDRLPPGELLEGPERAFGMPVPRGMELSQPARKVARFSGLVDFKALTDYVRKRVTVRHAELRESELVFPQARIRGGDPKGIYDVSLRRQGNHTVVLITDRTPGPTIPGLSSEERWKRLGLKPNGKLLDPKNME